MNILEDLKFRGLIYQATEGLPSRLKQGKIVVYAGFDPTAESLHLGNLLQLITLKRFQEYGHTPIILIGTGTALIGDPSGKLKERPLLSEKEVKLRAKKIENQIKKFFDFKSKINPARLINNYDWLGNLKLVEFLRDIGKWFQVNYMLSKQSIRSRLTTGISFAEFCYMLLQAYDFMVLNKKFNCELQIGGSDQWGNITAGVDLIRKKCKKVVYGLTLPLLVKADGTKFGKTESGNIWLDAKKTSPYQFYQFWINIDDRDVIKLIKYFTFLNKKEILNLQEKVKNQPEKREAQRTLAKLVTELVHGKSASKQAGKISNYLFYGKISQLSKSDLAQIKDTIPTSNISGKQLNILDLLVKTGICSSKRQAREDVRNGAICINGKVVGDLHKILFPSDKLFGKYLLVRRGKRKYFLINWIG